MVCLCYNHICDVEKVQGIREQLSMYFFMVPKEVFRIRKGEENEKKNEYYFDCAHHGMLCDSVPGSSVVRHEKCHREERG